MLIECRRLAKLEKEVKSSMPRGKKKMGRPKKKREEEEEVEEEEEEPEEEYEEEEEEEEEEEAAPRGRKKTAKEDISFRQFLEALRDSLNELLD